MSRKKTHLDEFGTMAKLHELLQPFEMDAITRMWNAVEAKRKAEQPKKRVRRRIDPLAVDSVQSQQAEASARKSAGIQ